jgi:hypothetical protein
VVGLDLWWTVGVFAGAIGVLVGVSLIAKWLGTSQFVTAISSVWNAIWSTITGGFQFLNGLPGPLKIVMFLVLFSLIGGFMYTATFGLTRVCDPGSNKIYATDPITGFAYQYYPETQADAGTTTFNSTSIAGTFLVAAGDLINNSLMTRSGIQYNTTWILSEINGMKPTFSDEYTLLPGRTQWARVMSGFLSEDQYYHTAVCMNRDDDTCALFRESLLLNGCIFPF